MRPPRRTSFHTKGKEAGRPGAGLAAPPAGSGLTGSIGYRVRATPVVGSRYVWAIRLMLEGPVGTTEPTGSRC